MDSTPQRKSTEIGNGIIDFPAIFAQKEQSGMKHFFLEQEEFKMDEFESLTISYNYLDMIK